MSGHSLMNYYLWNYSWNIIFILFCFSRVILLSGRRFPKKLNEQLILESRFDGELLATDPVAHSENPVFNSELAWEVSKKLLHQYKLQRTPIKLQCYAVDLQSKRRESIGYILLDLRTAAKQEESPALVPVVLFSCFIVFYFFS